MSAWVLVRGLTREARHWAELPRQMGEAGVEGEVLSVDLPGCGEHAAVRAPLAVGGMTEFVRRDLAARGYAPPYRFVALSLGAMVAVDWARRFPGEVERLVLINTSLRPFSGPLARLRPGAWPALLLAAARWRSRRAAEAAIHAVTCERRDKIDTDLAQWIAIYRSAPVSRANALRQLVAAARFRASREAPPCPVLIVSSREDALVDSACSTAIARAWDAEHRIHSWAGHDLPHDDAGWLATAIAEWACAVRRPVSLP
ncbi:alpha/beta hydrolase [Trinickia caryophylli]|uniref:Pimeloyl-ACP methyl ester carboxylesterase n=1 Tax=Trinickia caryophylli TaxID=28094 RepID=A0A1X7GD87_TRICW|nr:alpha/beta hydrolase [Trinickia caryophylli]PMS10806.1 alpha/beta hydrolase [Trinickia caryophylli]TRX13817.1 alpha/beta hydrolase [Trinickia caryophylli]WQE15408.1 alpha/beta hydrolase [Trinickia caryophylli]SMF67890.1 Pimeloyl-ACP methyl ester carboxylesterase [Trinickia caryophylli]GLU33856.1 alpha/beta hydrolase [Trinickia caryophylli]